MSVCLSVCLSVPCVLVCLSLSESHIDEGNIWQLYLQSFRSKVPGWTRLRKGAFLVNVFPGYACWRNWRRRRSATLFHMCRSASFVCVGSAAFNEVSSAVTATPAFWVRIWYLFTHHSERYIAIIIIIIQGILVASIVSVSKSLFQILGTLFGSKDQSDRSTGKVY